MNRASDDSSYQAQELEPPLPGSLPASRNVRQHGLPAPESLPLEERLRLRDAFFRDAGIDPRQFLQAFDHVPGLSYFVKDAQSRTMLNTREYAQLPDHPSDETIVGKRPG